MAKPKIVWNADRQAQEIVRPRMRLKQEKPKSRAEKKGKILLGRQRQESQREPQAGGAGDETAGRHIKRNNYGSGAKVDQPAARPGNDPKIHQRIQNCPRTLPPSRSDQSAASHRPARGKSHPAQSHHARTRGA